jgi:hypothetical protein
MPTELTKAGPAQIDVPEGVVNVKRAWTELSFFFLGLWHQSLSPGRASAALAGAGAQKGVVKTGPLGPPAGEALTAPGLSYRQPQLQLGPSGALCANWAGTAVTSPCSRAERAGRGPAA